MLYLMAPSIAWSRLTPLLGLGPRRVRCTAKRSGHPASHRDTEGHRINPTASCRRACPISRLTRPVGRQYKLHPARRRSSDQARPPRAFDCALQSHSVATALADKEEPHRWWSTHRAPAGHSRKPRPHAAAPTTGSQSSTRPTALDDGSDPRAAAWQSPVRMRIGQRQRLPQAPRALAGVGPFGRHLSRNRFRDERLPLSRRRHLALGAVALAPVGSSAPFWVAGNVGPP